MQRARDCPITREKSPFLPWLRKVYNISTTHVLLSGDRSRKLSNGVVDSRNGNKHRSGQLSTKEKKKKSPGRRSSVLLREEGAVMKDEVLSLHLKRPFVLR